MSEVLFTLPVDVVLLFILLLFCCGNRRLAFLNGCTDEDFADNSTRRARSRVGNVSNPNTTRRLTYNMRLVATASERHSGETEATQPLLQNNPGEEEDNPPEEGNNLPHPNYNPTVGEYSPPEGEYNPPQEEFCPSQGGYNPAQQSYNPTDGGCNPVQQGYNTDHQGSGYVDPQTTTANDVTLIDLI